MTTPDRLDPLSFSPEPVAQHCGMMHRSLLSILLALCVGLPATVKGDYKTVADLTTPSPLGGNFIGFSTGDISPALKNGTVAFIGGSPGHAGSYFTAPAAGGTVNSVVTYGDPMPGEGSPAPTFYTFGGFSLDGSTVAFGGGGPPGDGVGGLYKAAAGMVTTVVNTHTPIPGLGGFFSMNGYGSPSADRGQVAFFGNSSIGGNQGIYVTTPAGLVAVANKLTTMPGSADEFPGSFGGSLSLDGGNVAFAAQVRISQGIEAIFKTSGGASGTLLTVVDPTFTVPGSAEKFGAVNNPVLSGGQVAFWGRTAGFLKTGIYTTIGGGGIQVVADQNTPIPGGTGNFLALEADFGLSINGNRVMFLGYGEDPLQGIYLWEAGAIRKIVDSNDEINGKGIRLLSFGKEAFDGTELVFVANFDGEFFQGIYTLPVSPAIVIPKLVLVANGATAIPAGTGNFTSLPRGPSLSGNNVAFSGAGSNGQQGIYFQDLLTSNGPVRLVDLNTAIPGGTGNFTSFQPGDPIAPAIDGVSVAFYAEGSGGQKGIYVAVPGNPARVADTATAIPNGTGNFIAFPQAPAISGDNVAFYAEGSGGQKGIYVAHPQNPITPSEPIRVADTATAIPDGTGNFIAFPNAPGISGDNVAFLGNGSGGQQGVYRAGITGSPIRLADLNTAIPGGTGNFTSFTPTDPIAPAIDGASVAFYAEGSGGQKGIYIVHPPNPIIPGNPVRVADTATAIPGGTDNFTGFGAVSLSATDVAFLGIGANGQQGIYDLTGGQLVKAIATGEMIEGKTVTGLNLASTGLFGDPIAFQATFDDGSQALYVIAVAAPPFALRITALEKLSNDLRLSFTSLSGTDYAIQSSADLSPGTWATLPGTTNSGTGGTVQQTLTNAFAQPRQFYRIQKQ